MAKAKVAGRRPATQPIPPDPITASVDTKVLVAELAAIRCMADLLDDVEFGSTSASIPTETKTWLRTILLYWIRDTAGELEHRAERVGKFLDAQPVRPTPEPA